MRALLYIVTVAWLVLCLGLHWAVLQTMAWTGMVISYSRNASFKEAITQTFDGQHPCPLCKAIKQGRAEEKKQDQQKPKPGSELDPGLVWQEATFHFSCERARFGDFDSSATSRYDTPPKPRPRRLPCSHAHLA